MNIFRADKPRKDVPVAVFTGLALLLDLHSLTSKSLWGDEGFSLFMARTSLHDFWHIAHRGEGNMVLYYALLRIWLHLGHSEFMARAFSVLWAVASVSLIMALAGKLFGRREGTFSGLLLAIHPAEVYYSQEVRAYSLAIFLVTLSSWCFLRALERRRSASWAWYGVVSALALYTHLFSVFVLFAQWISLLFYRKVQAVSRRFLLLYAAVLVTLTAPMLLFVLRTYKGQLAWVSKTTPEGVFSIIQLLTLPKFGFLLYLAGWIAGFYAGFVQRRSDRWTFLFTACWLLAPIIITVTLSLHKPLLVPRFLLICLPASVLLASAGFASLPRPWAMGAVLLVVLLSAQSVVSFYRNDKIKEDWRGSTQYVLAHSRPGDIVVVLPLYERYTFDYYRDISAKGVNPIRLREADSLGSAAALPGPRIWVLRFLGSDSSPKEGLLRQLEFGTAYSCHFTDERQFNGIEVFEVERSLAPEAAGKPVSQVISNTGAHPLQLGLPLFRTNKADAFE